MDCFAIHLFFPSSNRREVKKGCREQVPCWGMYGQSPIILPRWITSQSICSPTFFKPPRSGERVQGTGFLLGYVWAKPHHPPSMDYIAIHLLSHLLQTAAKRRKGAGNNVPCWGMGQSPIVPHRPLVPRTRHSMRTFRPSIIAARALRENASNCLSVMCSIRLSCFTEPAAVVLAVGTP